MFFRVQNLGPLRDAEIDLSKDLIVLAGPNNSGKTCLAWSVYGLHRASFKLETALESWAEQLLTSPEHSIDVGELWARDGEKLLEVIAEDCRAKLRLCFATESIYFSSARVSLRSLAPMRSGNDSAIHLTAQSLAGKKSLLGLFWVDSARISGVMTRGNDLQLLWDHVCRKADPAMLWQPVETSPLTGHPDEVRRINQRSLCSLLAHMLLTALLPQCVLFPAERIAVNIFAKELALKRSQLIDEMVDADLEDQFEKPIELIRRKAGRYPWPIRDSLRTANDLASLSKEESGFADLADELERAVLGGAVKVSDQGELLYSPQALPEAHLAIHLTASVVKSLTSLVFYFRHLAKKGDFLIIDEPELNLHPDNQRKIARILAKAVRRGFKVMISTHSDYVLRELNHLIMLNKLPAEEAKELGYDPEFALDPARVGVYLVDEHRAESINIEETGFSIKTIDAVVNQLNIDEQRLYARLAD